MVVEEARTMHPVSRALKDFGGSLSVEEAMKGILAGLDAAGRSLKALTHQLPGVYPTTVNFLKVFAEVDRKQVGDPRKAARVMIDVAESGDPPLRLPLGENCITRIESELEKVKADISPWREAGWNTAFE